jgi:hypothetical protein
VNFLLETVIFLQLLMKLLRSVCTGKEYRSDLVLGARGDGF